MRYGFLITDDNDVLIVDQSESTSYQEDINSPDSNKWLEAMNQKCNPCMIIKYGP